MRRFPFFVFLASSLFAVGGSPARDAERGQVKPGERLQYDVSVVRKLIFVIVTDRQGRPVTDLRRAEFVLSDNGQEMAITEFESHVLSLPAEAPRPPAVPAPTAPAPAAPLMSRTFFFLFDLVFADPGGIRLAFQASQRFAETNLAPDDEIGVLSFSGGRSLNVHHLPDRDRAAAGKAIESIGLGSLMPIAPIRPIDDSGPTITVGGDSLSRGFEPSPRGSSVGRVVAGNFVWALDSLAQALRYTPGRKVIVLYSNGLHPSYLGRSEYMEIGNADLGRAYQEACRRLAAGGVSVFTINTEENTSLVAAVPDFKKGVWALREIASETGGRHLGDLYSVPDHMEKIETMTGAFYVLGYPIVEKWDGRFHKIRVKVARPGCRVNAQPGYFEARPFPAFSDLEKRIHLIDLALSAKPLFQEPVRFAMQALPWTSVPPDEIRFVAEIPVERLGDIAGPRLEAVSLVFNALDELVDTRRVELDLAGSEMREKPVYFLADLSAPPGAYKCRIVLRNPETGRAAVGAASTVVPPPDPKGVLLYPPILLIPGKPSICLGAGSSKRSWKNDPGDHPAADFVRGFPTERKTYVPLGEKPFPAGIEILAITRCAAPGRSAATAALSARLKDPDGGEVSEVPLSIVSTKADGAGQAFLLRLEIPKVGPGAYRLEISAAIQGLAAKTVNTVRIE